MKLQSNLAAEIVGVLKYNPQLSDEEKKLCVELRLEQFAKDIEKVCAIQAQHARENALIVDARPMDLPPLYHAMLAEQQTHGAAN